MGNKAQKETGSPPEGLRCLSPDDEAGLIGDLMMAAQGAALLLTAAHSHVQGDDWENVVAGVSVVLENVANHVDARLFGGNDG